MKSNSQQDQQSANISTSEQTVRLDDNNNNLHLSVVGGVEDMVAAATASMDDGDLELVFDKLKLNLNRTNSNASCNSTNSLLIDSGYISSNDLLDSSSCNQASSVASGTTPPLSSSSLSSSSFSPPSSASVSTYTLLQDSSHHQALPVDESQSTHKRLGVKAGYYGKAKTSSLDEPTMLLLTMLKETPPIEDQRVNLLAYGDDVGLLLSKSDSEQYYFAVADGVSANRARGYDPSLFPNALLTACGHYLLSHESCQLDLTTTSSEKDEQNSESAKTTTTATPYVQLSSESNETQPGEEEFYDEYDEELNDAEEIYEEYDDLNDDEADDNQFDIGANLLEDDQETDLLDEVFDASEERETRFLFEALKSAHETVEDQKVYGSSTVCLLSLKPDTSLHTSGGVVSYLLSTCNLGDSGYMIMRDRRVIFKSATQSHRYNAPYQIGCTPPELLDHDLYRDSPDDSVRTNHRVRPGDLLIISSDGLFDNLYEDEIAMVISNHLSSCCGSDDTNGATNKTVNNVTNEMLSSACELLVRRASTAGIKRDDMLIMLIHIE